MSTPTVPSASTRLAYRLRDWLDVGGNWTWSRTHGDMDGQFATGTPRHAEVHRYPEYKDRSWSWPEGDLSTDQRHKLRLWVLAEALLPRVSDG